MTRSERVGRVLGRMAQRHPRLAKAALVFAMCIGLTAWASYPPKILAIDNACMPDGFWKAASVSIYGNLFWTRQIEASAAYRERLERFPSVIGAANAQLDEELQKSKAFLEEQYRKYPQLAPSPAEQYASQLRTLADEAEHEEVRAMFDANRIRTISWLTRCEVEMGLIVNNGE